MALRLLDRGLALKDEAYESGPLSLLEDAVAAYAELEERFGRLRGAPFEEIVAVAVGMYNKAGTLESLGRTEEAAASFRDVATRHGDSSDRELREIGKLALVRERMMFAVPDPPPYIVEHPREQAMLADPEILEDSPRRPSSRISSRTWRRSPHSTRKAASAASRTCEVREPGSRIARYGWHR